MAHKSEALPILYYTGGWTKVGEATSVADATRKIRKLLSDTSQSLLKLPDWSLRVQKRNTLSIELNGGPPGYTWDIGATTGH